MTPLQRGDLLPPEAWERVRTAYREALIAHKRPRRVPIGDRVTLVFEDRETLRWQVQEMARVEGLRRPDQLQAELDVYNELVPAEGELSATLFIEITDATQIRPELDRLVGIDEHVALLLGDGGRLRVPARFDPEQLEEDRISAVQYVRFALGEEEARLLGDPSRPAALAIDHPAYRAQQPLAPETRESLARDLAGDPPPLVDLDAARRAAGDRPRDEVLEEGALLRVMRPGQPVAPGHLVIEGRDPQLTLGNAAPALATELFDILRRHAAALERTHGSCHLRADLERPLRWHLLAGTG